MGGPYRATENSSKKTVIPLPRLEEQNKVITEKNLVILGFHAFVFPYSQSIRFLIVVGLHF
jgi:hypothetical protein